MKKITLCLLSCLLLASGVLNVSGYTLPAHAESKIPGYAKWGRMAMQKTNEKYPNADVVDYLHIGKETKGTFSTEKFKLWLKEKNKEFGVLVEIEYDHKTEQVLRVDFQEVFR